MIKITNTPPLRPIDEKKKKVSSTSASGVEFKSFLSTGETSDTHETAEAQGVNSFLFLQEVSDDEVNRQKGMQQGKQLIQTLEQLHRDLLMGTIPENTLRRLETTLAQKRETFTDPRLQQLLNEIELRAAVELAKLERSRR